MAEVKSDGAPEFRESDSRVIATGMRLGRLVASKYAHVSDNKNRHSRFLRATSIAVCLSTVIATGLIFWQSSGLFGDVISIASLFVMGLIGVAILAMWRYEYRGSRTNQKNRGNPYPNNLPEQEADHG